MKISELSTQTGVPVATLKYYLREGLLQPGTPTARTQASYGDAHVERVRLVRALSEVGGLSLATVRRVLAAIADPDADRLGVLGAAQRALLGPEYVEIPPREECESEPASTRAHLWAAARGWRVDPRDPVLDQLDAAWAACDAARLGVDEERMSAYADAVERIAAIDVESVPPEPADAVRQVVLGSVLVDPVLTALRRLAQQHIAVTRAG